MENLGGSFRVDNIYAMYSTLSEMFLMYLAVYILGVEFQMKTINFLRISGHHPFKVYLSKFIAFECAAVIFGVVAWIEMFAYKMFYQNSLDAINLAWKLLGSYMLYGFLVFMVATLIVLIFKQAMQALFTTILFMILSQSILAILGQVEGFKRILPYIPFTFVRSSFSFASFTGKQVACVLIWCMAMFGINYYLFRRRGHI